MNLQNEKLDFSGSFKNEVSANYRENAGRASFFGVDVSYAVFKKFRIIAGASQLGLMPTEAGLSNGSIRKEYFGYNPTDFTLNYERVANPNLEWEKNFNIEFGFETIIIKDKLNVAAIYYHQKSSDFIGQDTVGSMFIGGISNVYIFRHNKNFGEIKSHGLEFQIKAANLKIGSIQYESTTNINFRSSEYVDLSGSEVLRDNMVLFGERLDPHMHRSQEGQQIASIYAPKFEGVDDEGNWILSTDNILEYPRTGNGLPNWFFGSYHNFNLNSWSLEFMLEGAFDHYMYNEARFLYQTNQSYSWNVLQSSSQITELGIDEFNYFSDFFVENAGYVRLNYISISKEFNTGVHWINSITSSFIINNLFTLTDYSGSDPAVSFRSLNRQREYDNLKAGENFSASWLQSRVYSLRLTFNLF